MTVKRTAAIEIAPADTEDDTPPRWRVLDYAILLKPRVMSLVVFVGFTGLLLAPSTLSLGQALLAVACIAIGAGAAGAINMWYDRDIDLAMHRTMNRPIPAGRLTATEALIFGLALSAASVVAMAAWVNLAAAGLLLFSILYYVGIYTCWLKRRTPQNIVIGGAAGAFPPVIGWAAATGTVSIEAFVLFAIIFLWTPPHSWALALFTNADYTRAGVPMLPVVAGARETKRQMAIYLGLLVPTTFAPVAIGMSGALYGLAAVVLNALFVQRMLRLWRDETDRAARPMFGYSILYLFLIFIFLLADRAARLFLW
jgi:protoheme IX farnesyltransferase